MPEALIGVEEAACRGVGGHARRRLGIGPADIRREEFLSAEVRNRRPRARLERMPRELRPVRPDVVRRVAPCTIFQIHQPHAGPGDEDVVTLEVAMRQPESRRPYRAKAGTEIPADRRDSLPLAGKEGGEL